MADNDFDPTSVAKKFFVLTVIGAALYTGAVFFLIL